MPANLPAEAKHKWAEVAAERNPNRKLLLLEEFLSLVPKHKGTENLRAQTKKKMANLRREIESKKKKRAGKGESRFFIEKEGAAQIVVISMTNAGRSSLITATTNANVLVSSAPYTTRDPVPGMLTYEDIQFQMIEAPALMEGSAQGRAWGLRTLALARNADGLILMVDLSGDPVAQLDLVLGEMMEARIFTKEPKGSVEVKKKFTGAGLTIILLGKLVDCSPRSIKQLLRSYGVNDAVVKLHGEVKLDEVEEAIFESTVHKPTIVLANKADVKQAKQNFNRLKNHLDGQLSLLPVSCKTRQGLEVLGRTLFDALGLIRVYTKELNKKVASQRPFILGKNANISDLAQNIHTDFSKDFSFAKVWAERLVFSPQKVGVTFRLEDGDTVEIHMK
jgi:ribosome-interacting GTPase 1